MVGPNSSWNAMRPTTKQTIAQHRLIHNLLGFTQLLPLLGSWLLLSLMNVPCLIGKQLIDRLVEGEPWREVAALLALRG